MLQEGYMPLPFSSSMDLGCLVPVLLWTIKFGEALSIRWLVQSSQSINLPHFMPWRKLSARPQAPCFMLRIEERIDTALHSVNTCISLLVIANDITIKRFYFYLTESDKARASSNHTSRSRLRRPCTSLLIVSILALYFALRSCNNSMHERLIMQQSDALPSENLSHGLL